MTDKEITLLLDTRNAVCKLASWYDRNPDTSAIDAILSEVAPGTDNRVDLALGRSCAVLPECAEYNVNHLHQCGWCGEWYTGARVDHGCPAPCHVVDDYSDESEDIDTDLSAADIIDMQERTAETIRAEDCDEREGSVI